VGLDVVFVDLQRLLGCGDRVCRTILAEVIAGDLGRDLGGSGIELACTLERGECPSPVADDSIRRAIMNSNCACAFGSCGADRDS
jgi:hypothetical protein